MYGILIGFTCKTWHCLYKIQCIGINKGTEQQTQQRLQKGEEGRARESFFLCRFWCQERACAAAYRKSVSGLGRQILLLLCLPANFQIIFCSFCCSFLLLCVCVCSLPLIANAGEMESALEHKTPTVVETVELHKYFYFYFYFYDAARSDNKKRATRK